MAADEAAFEEARVHLTIYGQERAIELPVRLGAATVEGLLPLARELSGKLTAIAVEHDGQPVSCAAGCGACCRQLVPISSVEARSLARVVDALPAPRAAVIRARFAAALGKLERLGLLDAGAPRGRFALTSTKPAGERAWRDVSERYFAAAIPCPFLEDESCSIYEDRPLTCREYLVTTPPERCAGLDEGARTVDRPVRLTEAVTRASSALAGRALPPMPLTLALEWAEAHGGALDHAADGEELFWELLRAVEEEQG